MVGDFHSSQEAKAVIICVYVVGCIVLFHIGTRVHRPQTLNMRHARRVYVRRNPHLCKMEQDVFQTHIYNAHKNLYLYIRT